METLTRSLVIFALVAQPLFLSYFLLYNTHTLWLILRSARQVRRRWAGRFVEDLDLIDAGDSTKPVTVIVPAFDEEATIVDRVNSLVHCDYPRFEVVVITDGSSDGTLDRLKQTFRLRRTEIPYRPAIATARVLGMYEATVPLPPGVMRLIVMEKEKGGRADALNTGINASLSPYFVSLDGGLILDQRGIKELMRVIQEDARVVAVGGQVAIANGCTIRTNRVVSVALPSKPLTRFQMVEYLRSFLTAGTGAVGLRSILIPSRVFAVFEKEAVIRAGGYLTPFLNHRITREYVGEQVASVCGDREIIVRLQRFVLDKLQNRRIVFLPYPVAWAEVPETIASLRTHRGRWYREMREALRYHSGMLWRGKYGGTGSFALPSLWLFEYYGPLIEILGYACLALLLVMERVLNYPLVSQAYVWAFLLASLGYGVLVNVLAVLVGAWHVRYGMADRRQSHLLPFGRRREPLILLAYAVLEHFGYRQLALYLRLRGNSPIPSHG
ncbi:MAG TPA: glycosyltransferase family 2 protein [Gemmatimonadales bacterium]|nr:glycosyltransferase family 2 protein [Gemmatimonadales bacterium]